MIQFQIEEDWTEKMKRKMLGSGKQLYFQQSDQSYDTNVSGLYLSLLVHS